MKVVQVPVLDDNYAYLLIDTENNIAAAVDPAEPEKVLKAAENEGVDIVAVLTTHHHWDHSNGNKEMKATLKDIKVYGGEERIPAMTDKVGQDSEFKVGNIPIKVLFTPCHTTGHVLYFADHENERVLFSGDTLFLAGCGRFFEGTAEQMVDALCNKVKALPKDTKVMCGHEYSVKNLEFAAKVDPNNEHVTKKLEWARAQRANKQSTIPSTIEEELSYNPFLRVDNDEIKKEIGLPQGSHVEVMAKLRELKNAF